jgi:hypothetical protein
MSRRTSSTSTTPRRSTICSRSSRLSGGDGPSTALRPVEIANGLVRVWSCGAGWQVPHFKERWVTTNPPRAPLGDALVIPKARVARGKDVLTRAVRARDSERANTNRITSSSRA